MESPISLSELNTLIRQTLDSNLPPQFWVIAEIGEFRDSPRGHAYLDLVEKSGNHLAAKIKANIWSYTYQGIRNRFVTTTGQHLSNGMKILALVSVQFHEIYGLSVNIKDIDPNYTIGERARRKQEIIDRLTREGQMHLNKQFVLPRVPQRLAVISSSTAAGLGDFENQLKHNVEGYRVHWKLFPATMQGNEASGSIIHAISLVEAELRQEQYDLLVIIRGGGAQTDMDCFDDYDLARAIAACSLPVVTGIGHDRDECIADLVAHTKMKTPTAAAEFILSGFRDFENTLQSRLKQLERASGFFLQKEDRRLRDREHLLKSLFLNKTSAAKESLNSKRHQLRTSMTGSIKMRLLTLESLDVSLKRNVRIVFERENNRLKSLDKDLSRLDPRYYLAKGYAWTEIDGVPINRVEARKGDNLTTFTLTKKITSKIDAIEENEQ